MSIYLYVYTEIHTQTHTRTQTNMHARTHAQTHTRTQTHTHIHTHKNTDPKGKGRFNPMSKYNQEFDTFPNNVKLAYTCPTHISERCLVYENHGGSSLK